MIKSTVIFTTLTTALNITIAAPIIIVEDPVPSSILHKDSTPEDNLKSITKTTLLPFLMKRKRVEKKQTC